MKLSDTPNVAIYRRGFLPLSETFISDHIQGLNRYNPIIITENILNGYSINGHTPHLLHRAQAGKYEKVYNRLTGRYRHVGDVLSAPSTRLIHAHFLQDGANILSLAARRNIPLVVTAHGYDATVTAREHARRTEGLWYLMLKPFLLRYAHGIICVSQWIKQCLLDAGYPDHKLRVIPLGIDTSSLPPPPAAHGRRGALFVGRLVEKKGVNFLLDAWAKLPERIRSEPLTIIGDGPLMSTLVAQAHRLGIQPHFLGARSRAEVFAAMARHRIFAMPSVRAANGDSEGLPIVLMEAQAMGMAVIAFDDGPMREAIKPGMTGLLARSRNSHDFADHLQTLLGAPDLCGDFGRAGRSHVAAKFDLRNRVAALEDYYDEILASTEARS